MEINGRRMRNGDEEESNQNHHQQQQNQAARRSGGDLLGRHRLSAAISLLDKEIESLQKELEEVETMKPASARCKQVISNTERSPDALLPMYSFKRTI